MVLAYLRVIKQIKPYFKGILLCFMDYHRRKGRGKGYYGTYRDFEGKFIIVKRVSTKEYLNNRYPKWIAIILRLIVQKDVEM